MKNLSSLLVVVFITFLSITLLPLSVSAQGKSAEAGEKSCGSKRVDTDGDGICDKKEGKKDKDDKDKKEEEDSDVPDTDDDGIPNYEDPDDDGDGIPTEDEIDEDDDGDDEYLDTDADDAPDYLDPDDDGDEIPTADEITDELGLLDEDGDGLPDYLEPDDVDTDGDGLTNDVDTDDDGDGIPTEDELEVSYPIVDGEEEASGPEPDNTLDPDIIVDESLLDTDDDDVPNYLDPDDDGDGIPTEDEVFSLDDVADADNDTVVDYLEPDNVDTDGDGIPNVRDGDDDGDGLSTVREVRSGSGGSGSNRSRFKNTDDDSLANYLDTDDDGDGVRTEVEVAAAERSENIQAMAYLNTEVAASTTSSLAVCRQYLGTYMRAGQDNQPQAVAKLQRLLNILENETLNVTGVYNSQTETAVRRFQSNYASDILAPWQITEPTGYVYINTVNKVNELYCENRGRFNRGVLEQAKQALEEILGRLSPR